MVHSRVQLARKILRLCHDESGSEEGAGYDRVAGTGTFKDEGHIDRSHL